METRDAIERFIKQLAPQIRVGLSGENAKCFDAVISLLNAEVSRRSRAGRPLTDTPKPRALESRRRREKLRAQREATISRQIIMTGSSQPASESEDWGA